MVVRTLAVDDRCSQVSMSDLTRMHPLRGSSARLRELWCSPHRWDEDEVLGSADQEDSVRRTRVEFAKTPLCREGPREAGKVATKHHNRCHEILLRVGDLISLDQPTL